MEKFNDATSILLQNVLEGEIFSGETRLETGANLHKFVYTPRESKVGVLPKSALKV